MLEARTGGGTLLAQGRDSGLGGAKGSGEFTAAFADLIYDIVFKWGHRERVIKGDPEVLAACDRLQSVPMARREPVVEVPFKCVRRGIGREGHGIGVADVDFHAATFAPNLTDVKHSLKLMGITSYDVVHECERAGPRAVTQGEGVCIREAGMELG